MQQRGCSRGQLPTAVGVRHHPQHRRGAETTAASRLHRLHRLLCSAAYQAARTVARLPRKRPRGPPSAHMRRSVGPSVAERSCGCSREGRPVRAGRGSAGAMVQHRPATGGAQGSGAARSQSEWHRAGPHTRANHWPHPTSPAHPTPPHLPPSKWCAAAPAEQPPCERLRPPHRQQGSAPAAGVASQDQQPARQPGGSRSAGRAGQKRRRVARRIRASWSAHYSTRQSTLSGGCRRPPPPPPPPGAATLNEAHHWLAGWHVAQPVLHAVEPAGGVNPG